MEQMQPVTRAHGTAIARRNEATPARAQGAMRPQPEASINVHGAERVASAVAGGLALAWAARRRSAPAALGGLLGAALVHRAVTGHCSVYGALGVNTAERDTHAAHQGIDLSRSLTIQAPASELFRVIRQPETFAQLMGHFATLRSGEAGRTEWTVHAPLGKTISWHTKVVEERPDELLRFASEGGPLDVRGGFHLRAAPADRGTEVRLQIRFDPPLGALGRVLTKLLGPAPSMLVERALGNLKSLIEAGELPSLHHNPAARASARL